MLAEPLWTVKRGPPAPLDFFGGDRYCCGNHCGNGTPDI
jgi:hypothetical protein